MTTAPVKVMLVEENPAEARQLQVRLEETVENRFAFVHTNRLGDALERLEREPFDVILLDLNLPDSTGPVTFMRARAAAPELPIILLTGVDDEAVGSEAVREGVQDYLIKGQADGRQIARAIRYAIERKRAEEAERQMKERVRQTQKLESLGALAEGIAHDFNNLFTVALGHAELALMELPAASPAATHVGQILKATQRAAELSRQMLAYSGKARLVLEPVNLSRLIQDTNRMLEISVSKKIRLRYQLAEGLPAVLADPTQLRQAAMNLVLNAAEAIGDREGAITVTTLARPCDRAYLDTVGSDQRLAEGLYVGLEVADSGCGMDPATLARVFDPFFTTKFVGRGLGLAVVQGIVRSHRGAITVQSEPGRGTTFRILLPAAEAPARPGPPQTGVPEPWRGRGLVLLVDDEEMMRVMGTHLLERLGFSVLAAGDGAEAVKMFQARRGDIVCAILDMAMPRLNGAETLRELRQIQPDVRAIICSGYDEQQLNHKFQGLGSVAFVQKPYQLADLAQKLRLLLTGDAA